METIGIKVLQTENISKCVRIIRKYEDISISEIKRRITQAEYLITCDYIDDVGLTHIICAYNELSKLEVSCELFEHDRKTNINFLRNLLKTYQKIDEDIENDDV